LIRSTSLGGNMAFVDWDEKYLLGIEQFDLHHRHLVELLNHAYDMLVAGWSDDAGIKMVLNSLAEYSAYHFESEENWMGQVEYPEKESHILEHKKFIYRWYELNKQFEDDKSYLTLEIVTFLKGWLLGHILDTDAAYVTFIKQQTSLA